MTRDELLRVIYRYYPRGLCSFNEGYDETEEVQLLRAAVRRGAAEYPRWKALLARLRTRYRLVDRSLCMLVERSREPAYSAEIRLPGRILGAHVSLLSPYYGIHQTDAPDEQEVAHDVEREILASFVGYKPVPPDLGDQVVPDVSQDGPFGRETVYTLLFSTAWTTTCGTWPPQP